MTPRPTVLVPVLLCGVVQAAAAAVAGGQPRDPRPAVVAALTTREEGVKRMALDGATSEAFAVLAEADRGLLGGITGERVTTDTAATRLRAWGVEALRMALDGYAVSGPWGDRRLRMIAALYPRNAVVLGHAADLALRRGLADSAGRIYLALTRREPTVIAWHRGRATAAAAAGQAALAAASWVAVLELDPTDEPAFRALLGLPTVYSLDRQLVLVRRLRQRRPNEAVLVDREVELLQRMGRLEEAQAVARKKAGEP